MTATDRSSGPPTRRVLRLGRSPFEAAVMLRFGVAAALALAVTVVLGLPLAGEPPAFDARLAAATTAPEDSTLNLLAYVIGRLGHLWFVVAVALVIAVVARRRSGRWDLALLMAAVLGGATVITGLAKVLTDRARPDSATVSTLSAAFPSGHSVRAAAVFGLVAWVLTCWSRRAAVGRLVIPVAAVLVLTNGAARVVLGVHWPTDVLAGITLGTVWLLVCLRLLRPAAVPLASGDG
jgi:undecaprenyl-diphosphatase